MRDILKPGIALLVIAAIAAGILGYVNSITAEPIAKAELNATTQAVAEVLPEVDSDSLTKDDVKTVEDFDGVTSYVVAKDKSGEVIGYAISTVSNGFSAGYKLMFGVDLEGKITGLSVVDCSNETPGLGANVKTDEKFRNQFVGKEGTEIKVTKDGGDIDSLTGATITSRATANAANTAIDFFNKNLNAEGGAN